MSYTFSFFIPSEVYLGKNPISRLLRSLKIHWNLTVYGSRKTATRISSYTGVYIFHYGTTVVHVWWQHEWLAGNEWPHSNDQDPKLSGLCV